MLHLLSILKIKNMNRLTLIVLGILLTSLYSCKYDCPGFSDKDLHWVPYNLSDTLKYVNNNDTIEFVVINFYKNPPTSFYGLAMDIAYNESAYYSTNKIPLYGYKLEEKYELKNTINMNINVTDNDIFVFNPYSFLDNDSIKISFHSDTLINNVNYSQVYVIKKDTMTLNPRISEVIKSVNKGIIQFYDFSTKKKWNLITN